MKKISDNEKNGFTLIELLIVVSLIGILSGVLINVINVKQQRAKAQDSVIRTDLSKLVQSLESYCAAEATCPPNVDFTDTSSVLRTVYIKAFPTDSTFTYVNEGGNASPTSNFQITAPLITDIDTCLKYRSEWGAIKQCPKNFCGTAYDASIDSCQ